MNSLRVLLVGLFLLTVFCVPGYALAQAGGAGTVPGPALANPLGTAAGSIQTIPQLITKVIQWLLSIAAVVALFALVVGGFRFILAFGKEDELKRAKSTITWSIVGLVLIMLAFFIVQLIARALGVVGA